MNQLATAQGINFLLVFVEGLLSFFSPCVLPLIPIYLGYLAGSAQIGPDGEPFYPRGRTMINTLCFVIGVSGAFFLLGASFSAIGQFFAGQRAILTRVGGILIMLMGLVQIGFFELRFLQRERRIHLDLTGKKVGPVVALMMGFTFSFAWTPCIGPALSSVLILASGAKSALTGNLLVLVYTLGFVIPFLLLGLFTTRALAFFERNRKLLKYTVKVGGALLILIGLMTFTGWMNGVSGYLSSISGPTTPRAESSSQVTSSATQGTPAADASAATSSEVPVYPAYDFTLTDQYGEEHTLSDYKGQVVFLNFWATWCPPCQQEMPEIEAIYKELGENAKDVVILGVANPANAENPHNQDVPVEEVKAFLDEKGYTFPTVMDTTGEIFGNYYVSAFPTTFLIDREGNLFGLVPGAMNKDRMLSVINQTLAVA